MAFRAGAHGRELLVCLAVVPVLTPFGAGPDQFQDSAALVPLAYVRRLAVLPLAVRAPSDPEGPLDPGTKTSDPARRERLRSERNRVAALRLEAAEKFQEALLSRLRGLLGLQLVDPPGEAERDGLPAAVSAGADAALAVALDRFGMHSGLEREIWLRVEARVALADGEVRGPYHAVGWARAPRRILGKSYQKPDSQLVAEAAAQAATRLACTLDSGVQSPFASSPRVVILPAAVPSSVEKQTGSSWEQVPVPSLARQADVLLQPELHPGVYLVPATESARLPSVASASLGRLWRRGGGVDLGLLRRALGSLDADLVFASRVVDAELTESPLPDASVGKPAREMRAEVEAEAALIRIPDGAVLWRARTVGSTTDRTEYVRGRRSQRTDEQCVLDAARVAYANLRFSLQDFERRFDRLP